LRRDDRGPADEMGQQARTGDAEQDAGHPADRGQNDRPARPQRAKGRGV
jgi:hypothetical protein